MLFFHELSQARHLHERGIWEKRLIDWIIECGFISPTKDFVDVGAHCGSYTITCGKKASKIHSFECNPQVFCYLAANVALHGLESKTFLHQCALGDENDKMSRYIIRSQDGGGNGLKRLNDADDERSVLTVEMKTLDSFNLTNVGFIKIDVEGYELEVIKGAVNTLKENNYPRILFESWGDWKESEGVKSIQLRQEVFSFLSGYGYSIIEISNVQDMFLAEHTIS